MIKLFRKKGKKECNHKYDLDWENMKPLLLNKNIIGYKVICKKCNKRFKALFKMQLEEYKGEQNEKLGFVFFKNS